VNFLIVASAFMFAAPASLLDATIFSTVHSILSPDSSSLWDVRRKFSAARSIFQQSRRLLCSSRLFFLWSRPVSSNFLRLRWSAAEEDDSEARRTDTAPGKHPLKHTPHPWFDPATTVSRPSASKNFKSAGRKRTDAGTTAAGL